MAVHCRRTLVAVTVCAATALLFVCQANPAPTNSDAAPASAPYLNPALPIPTRVADLIARMTLEEKVSQMMNDAPAIPRLGIPAYNWWNECLHGVAAPGIATVFPQAIGLGATWNPDLIFDTATAISDEARARHHQGLRTDDPLVRVGLTFWSPNINIVRDPRWGRGQETYGEDPYLTARLGVQFVRGLQGDDPNYLKLVSTPKHYAVHSGPDPERHRFDAKADDRNLYETYLPHFEACVREANAASVMCAYNRFEGEPCCSHERLLEGILRNDWGFQGYVVSDCEAIRNIFADHKVVATPEEAAARALNAGCDLNCGSVYSALPRAVAMGLATEAAVDRSLGRLFHARFKLGMFDPPDRVPYADIPFSVVDSEPHRKLSLRTARESIVLLKNEGDLLPLPKNLGSIAVIGPNADDKLVLYGNYNGWPSYAVTPLAGISRAVSSHTKVFYAKGCDLEGFSDLEPIPAGALRSGPDGNVKGLKAEYFANTTLAGTPALVRTDSTVDFNWAMGSPHEAIPNDDFSVRWSGVLIPPETGDYVLATAADDGARLFLDGKLLIEDWNEHAVATHKRHVRLEAGRQYSIVFEYYDAKLHAVARLLWSTSANKDRTLHEALEAARRADVTVLVMGISNAMEGEMLDRHSIELPPPQQNLLEKVHAIGKPVALVLLGGSAIAVPWADRHVPAIVKAWYPGQEGGTAIADTLFGDSNPGGRLPITVYSSDDQIPSFQDYNVAAGRTYKYFRYEPLYPFGYGLSYTKFNYSGLKVSPTKTTPGEAVVVSVTVKNTGKRAGDEVVQLYVSRPADAKRTVGVEAGDPLVPIRSLQGFRRVHLEPGKSERVEFRLDPKQLTRVDEKGRHVLEPGGVRITVGGGQPGVAKRSGGKIGEPLRRDIEIVGAARFLE